MQTTLKHDSQGFLVGEPIDLSQAVADWAAIRDDVHAIRMAIAGIGRQLAQAPNNQTPHAGVASVVATFQSDVTTPGVRMPAVHVVVPPARVPSAANAPSAASPVGVAVPSRGRSEFSRPEVQSVVPLLVQPSAAYAAEQTRPSQAHSQITPAELAVIAPHVSAISPTAELGPTPTQFHATPTDKEVVQRSMERGSDGRFVKKSGEEPSVGIDGRTQQAVHDLAERVVGVVRESGASLTEVDPAAKALSEVTQPIARGYALLRGGGKEGKGQEGWLRRIYAALAGWRKPAPVVAPAGVAGLGAESPVGEAGAGRPVQPTTAESAIARAAPSEPQPLADGVPPALPGEAAAAPALTGLVVRSVAAPGVTSPVNEAGAGQPAQAKTAEPAIARAAPSVPQPLADGALPALPGNTAVASVLTAPVIGSVAAPSAASPVGEAGTGKPVPAKTTGPVSLLAGPADFQSLAGGARPATSGEAPVAPAVISVAAPNAASPVGEAGASQPAQPTTAEPATSRAAPSELQSLTGGAPPAMPGDAAGASVLTAPVVTHVAVPGAVSPVNKAGAGKPVLAQTAEPVSPRAAPAELRSLTGGVLLALPGEAAAAPVLTGPVVRNVAAPGVTSPVGEAGASQPAQPTTAEPATSRAAPSELQSLTGGAPPAMPGDAAGASVLTAPVVTHVAVPGAVSPVNKAGAGKPVLAQTAEPVSPRAVPAELRSLTGGVLPAMSREAAVASALPSIAAPSAASPVGDAGAGKPVQAKTAGPANTRAILSGLRLLASGVPPVIPGEAAVTPVQEALAVAHVAVPGAASPVNEAGAGQPVQAKTAELAIARAAASELQSLLADGVPPGIPGEAAVTTPVLEAPAVAHVAAPGAAPLTRDTSVGKPMQVRAAEPVSPRAAPAELRSLAGGVLPALPGEAAAAPMLTAPVVIGVAAPAEIQSLGGDVSPAAPRGVGATAAWPTPASPSVAAFGMMATPTDVAQPKGMALPRGEISPEAVGSPKSDKRRDGLLRSILATLTGLRKEETAFNKAASKSLKNIEDKPDGGGAPGGGGMLGGLLPLLMRLPVLGTLITGLMSLLTKAPMLGRLFGAGDSKAAGASTKPGLLGRILGKSASPSVGAAPGVVAEAGAVAKGATAKAGRVAGNLAKRLPILGALLAVGSGALESTAIEGDATATRDDKNARHGKNWGGIGGGLAGATLGASLGSVVPVVGTIVGGLVGAVVGEWLGSSAGEVIGKHFAGLTEAMLNGWSEVKVAALGTWDWVKASWDDQVSEIGGIFTKLREALEEKWSGFVASAETEWKTISGMFASAYEGLKSLPGIGSAIKAAEAGVRKIAEAAGSAKDGAIELGGRAVDAVKSGAGSAWEATKSAAGSAWSGATNFAAGLVPQGLKDKVAARRALETGANYRQGNIAGLDEAHTRALVASTAATESAGGKLDVINSAGYMGRYQAGAGWLAEAGLIKGGGAAVKAAMKADGFTNEYKWGQEGGMTRFLKNPDNWSGGMSYDKYLASADTQDAAFKINSDKSYQSLVRKGVITPKMSQDEVAGILKARHIAGEGGAARAARGEDGPADANGTTALKYKNDLAPGNAFTQAFTPGATTAAATMATKPVTAPAAPQNLSQKLPLGTTTPAGAAVRDIASSGGAMTLASAGTGSPLATPAMPVVAAVKMPAVPSMPTAPKITEAPPPMAVPLASNEGRKPLAVIAAPSDVGQNVRDRGIAHIATGGLGGAGA